MGGWVGIGILGLSLVATLAGSAAAAPARSVVATPAAACRLDVVGSGRVVSVTDGRSLALDDGREVRLAGIEVPPPPNPADKNPGDGGPRAAAALAAKAALESLVLGQTVELRQRQQATDRYGRILAFISLPEGWRSRMPPGHRLRTP